MAVVLALLTALSYGTADFLGGLLTKRSTVLAVTFFSQLTGLVFLAVALAFSGGELSPAAIWWGLGTGVCGAAGVPLLYRGLATGRMNIVAPTTALIAAGVPVVVGLALGDRPGALALIGVGGALIAVALIASGQTAPDPPTLVSGGPSPGSPRPRHGMLDAIGAGSMFGTAFVFLDQTPDDSGLWPLVAARLATTVLIGVACLAIRKPPGIRSGTAGTLVAVGALDAVANVSFLLAVREGLLSIVGVLSSLYPAATVVLARVVLKERATAVQGVGLLLAIASVAMIATG